MTAVFTRNGNCTGAGFTLIDIAAFLTSTPEPQPL